MREDQAGLWSQFDSFLDIIPEYNIAIVVYLLGTLIILWCWYGIARRLPTTLGAISWIVIFAILVTPTISEGPNSAIAPAAFGLIFGILTKDTPLIWSNISLISFVIGLGLLLGYFWSKYASKKPKDSSSKFNKLPPL